METFRILLEARPLPPPKRRGEPAARQRDWFRRAIAEGVDGFRSGLPSVKTTVSEQLPAWNPRELTWVGRRSSTRLFIGGGLFFYPRPNLNPGVPLELFGPGYPGGKIFNKAAFTAAPAGQQGNFGRNVLRGFG